MDTALHIKLLYTQPEAEQDLRNAVNNISRVEVSAYHLARGEDPAAVPEIDKMDVVIYEMDEHSEADLDALESFIRNHPFTAVYATHNHLNMDTMRRLMRAGVKDTFPKPLRAEEMLEEIKKLSLKKEAESNEGKGTVVSFMSAKGGSGCTTVASNLAYELASKNKLKVLLIDLDIQFGDVAMSLDLKHNSTVIEALSQADRLDKTMLDAVATDYEDNLSVLASPSNLGRICEIKNQDIKKVITVAKDSYDIIVLDLPRLFIGWTVEALKASDRFILVIQRALPVLRDAKLVLEELPMLNIDRTHAEVLENRFDSKQKSINDSQIEKILGVDHTFKVHNDFNAAMSSQDKGLPIVKAEPRSQLSKDVSQLAKQVVSMHTGEVTKGKGLFAKLFGHD